MSPESATACLVERIRSGDSAAEAELVEQFHGRVFAMTVAKTGDPEVARDLSQEVMISVLCALREGRLRDQDGLTGYVLTTTRNRISYYFRSRHRRGEVNLPSELVQDLPNPEEQFVDTERRQLAARAIRSLGDSERAILQLSLLEGLAPAEIAARMRLSAQVVRKRKQRALLRIRRILQKRRSRSA